MPALLQSPLRAGLRRAKAILKSSRTVRNLLSDLDNLEAFGNLYEHEQMVADALRVQTYRQGLARALRPGDVVLDLGTGTGILAFLAARHGAARVYAIDHSPFIAIAERIARENGIGNVTFARANSRAYTPPEPVDVLLHEQIGDDLFDENMVENLLELKKRVLRKGGRILPGRFELYLEPVSLKPGYHVPFLWEQRIDGIDFSFLKRAPALAPYTRADHDSRYLRWGALEHFLCEPAPLLAFDLNAIETPEALPRELSLTRTVVRDGPLHGLCLYFRVVFDEHTAFDTSPARAPTHWGNRLFRLERRECRAGERLALRVAMPELAHAPGWRITLD